MKKQLNGLCFLLAYGSYLTAPSAVPDRFGPESAINPPTPAPEELVLPEPQFPPPEIKRVPQKVRPVERVPASAPLRSESTSTPPSFRATISSFELSPTIGSISIFDKSALSFGAIFSINITREQQEPLYLEPSVLFSLLSGDNNHFATIFHFDAGLRYDFVPEGLTIVPFLRAALGPSFTSTSDIASKGNSVPRSYFNAFAGGGLKILISSYVHGRADIGLDFQSSNIGLYAMGGLTVPF